jgi:hypothetical protein
VGPNCNGSVRPPFSGVRSIIVQDRARVAESGQQLAWIFLGNQDVITDLVQPAWRDDEGILRSGTEEGLSGAQARITVGSCNCYVPPTLKNPCSSAKLVGSIIVKTCDSHRIGTLDSECPRMACCSHAHMPFAS